MSSNVSIAPGGSFGLGAAGFDDVGFDEAAVRGVVLVGSGVGVRSGFFDLAASRARVLFDVGRFDLDG